MYSCVHTFNIITNNVSVITSPLIFIRSFPSKFSPLQSCSLKQFSSCIGMPLPHRRSYAHSTSTLSLVDTNNFNRTGFCTNLAVIPSSHFDAAQSLHTMGSKLIISLEIDLHSNAVELSSIFLMALSSLNNLAF